MGNIINKISDQLTVVGRWFWLEEEETMVKLLDIPGEVLSHNLFPLLNPNDIIRLRRVCKPLKALVDDHLRLNVRNNRLLFIGDKCYDHLFKIDKTEEEMDMDFKVCREFISMKKLVNIKFHLPVARVALDSRTWEWDNIFAEDENSECPMKIFLEKYGEQITELNLTELSVSIPMRKEKEIAFFEAFPNLTRLSIRVLVAKDFQEKNVDEEKFLFPETFKNLKHFRIFKFVLSQQNYVAENEYFWKMVEYCQNLELLVHPSLQWENFEILVFFLWFDIISTMTAFGFRYLGGLLQIDRLPFLKYYDLESHHWQASTRFAGTLADVCTVCTRCDVRLLNVTPDMFKGLLGKPLENIGRSTVSLKDLSIECFMVPFPNLEKLHVTNHDLSLESGDGQTTWRQFGAPIWPKLKVLNVKLTQSLNEEPGVAQDLLHILFEARKRPTVTHLRICIADRYCSIPIGRRKNQQIPLTLLKRVAWSCCNLRKVCFVAWTGTNKALSIFWEKLPLLEDICIADSPAVGNSAFVGKDPENPVFLRLKNLKTLSLLSVQNMQKITDTVFISVFRHMKIQSFYLTSWERGETDPDKITKINSITKEGIRSLLTSNFAKHIERFPFDTWMLDDMDEAEFHKLRDEFRSTQMH